MTRKKKQRASRKAPREIGVIRKDWRGRTRMALIYPNRYQAGMANLGFQQVYRIVNSSDAFVCERAFLPEPGDSLVSVESCRPLVDFDILAFSLSFENDYLNILRILETAGIPFLSADRSSRHPLIMAGGVACMLNPEPVAPFIDCFLIGEAEAVLPSFMTAYQPENRRDLLLEALAREIPGIYVPALYNVSYNADGTLSEMRPAPGIPEKVSRMYLRDLSGEPTCSTVLSDSAVFSSRYLVEVSRGCPHGCRFCGAGFVYRPPRFRPECLLAQCLKAGARNADRIGLVGAAVSDVPEIDALCREAQAQQVRLSFSSLRADCLSEALISALQGSGVKTATIAPDAGSQRLRTVINKGLSETEILDATRSLVAAGIPNLKLYFMVGLPTETGADVQEIISLCRNVKAVFLDASRSVGRIGDITVSIGAFVPKPATPFQWVAMDTVANLRKKLKSVKQELKAVANVRVHADNPQQAFIQALLSRGDRRVSRVLVDAHGNRGNWPQTFKSSALDPSFYVHRVRPETERFPWDYIDHGIERAYLWREYQRALEEKSTPACPTDGDCARCGVCKQLPHHAKGGP